MNINISLDLVLAIVAAVLGIIDVLRSRGRAWAGLGVIALAAIYIIAAFK